MSRCSLNLYRTSVLDKVLVNGITSSYMCVYATICSFTILYWIYYTEFYKKTSLILIDFGRMTKMRQTVFIFFLNAILDLIIFLCGVSITLLKWHQLFSIHWRKLSLNFSCFWEKFYWWNCIRISWNLLQFLIVANYLINVCMSLFLDVSIINHTLTNWRIGEAIQNQIPWWNHGKF